MAPPDSVAPRPGRPKTGYIPTLDGWRAIAVGMVLFDHTSSSLLPLPLLDMRQFGALGVDLFFAISGLLICSRLLEEERLTGIISLKNFYIRRTFRIFPAAWLYLLTLALLAVLHVLPMDWPAWGSAMLFWRNYFTSWFGDLLSGGHTTGHFWSLAVEEHFYLLLPSLLVLFPRHRKQVLFGLMTLAVLWLILYLHITPVTHRSYEWWRRTDLRIYVLLLPAWIALFLVEPQSRTRIARWCSPQRILGLLAAVAVLLCLKHVFFPGPFVPLQGDPNPVDRGALDPPGYASFIYQVLAPLLFPVLLLSTILHPHTWLGRLLEWRPLREIGRVSYSIYLWQQLFWAQQSVGWPIAALQRPWIAPLFVVAASVGSYFFIEKPLIRLGHRLAPPATPGHRDLKESAPKLAEHSAATR